MMVLMDALQTSGVAPEIACQVASSLVRDDARLQRLLTHMDERRQLVHELTGNIPAFVDVYGRGGLMDMANSKRRNLNVVGLDAFDLRTCEPCGGPWDFPSPRIASRPSTISSSTVRHG